MIKQAAMSAEALPPTLKKAFEACRRHFIWAALFSALVNVLYLAPTIYMLQVYDRVIPTGGVVTLVFVTIAVLFALATLAALDGVRNRLLVRAGLRLDRLLAGEVLWRLVARGRSQRSARVNQAMREFDALRGVISGPGAAAVLDAPWIPVYLLFCFLLHPLLGLLTLFGAGALLTLAVANERATKAKLQRAAEASALAYAGQEATAQNAEAVRALGMRRALVARQLSDRDASTGLQAEAQFVGGRYQGLIKFLRLSLQSLALGLGAWLAVERQISAGAVIAASVLLSRALQPIEQIVGAWSGVVQARGAMKTLTELFSDGEDDARRTQLPPPSGALQVEGATLRAPGGGDRFVLKGVSFELKAGETLGLIGPSGAGKTTLARLIAGAVPPDYGGVRLDGSDLRDWEPERLARHVGYLPQDSALFSGSIRDNISRFETWTGASDEEIDAKVVAAAKAADAHELIARLPQGYDTVLGPGGRGLSAGQSQRVALARALYGEPVLFVMDEPNSHLDAHGEAALVRTLQGLKARGATVIVVAHRTGVLAGADKLLVLRDGTVDLFGPPAEVIARLQRPAEPALPDQPDHQRPAAAAAG